MSQTFSITYESGQPGYGTLTVEAFGERASRSLPVGLRTSAQRDTHAALNRMLLEAFELCEFIPNLPARNVVTR